MMTEGVSFFLSKEASKALKQWKPVSSRIIVAKFRTGEKKINLVVIECYAPTNDASEEQKQFLRPTIIGNVSSE